ncbi:MULTISPECIES: UxaA family hydrolase [unclassified Paenibacillus]|uniref:UxaA family hydrolase n=1 Tax=unclassified Paenibacillus TaxID=185978 RepID=UPI001AE1E811|nr:MULTISPECIES: UxaA family hydrolase [unclassified Paenibacillus]MBP1153968.1 altronate dehydratase [Paenibacillus sp. PvP091]MBP1170647.1 altronate dehydratase [Paenibacillus sp. PvR098]MBP2441675.1 altronate dehydratase [Paenibacillus sp. PvP052]
MNLSYHFDEVGRLPLPGDNVAVATRQLDAGTIIYYQGQTLTLDYTVMEGHRFAVKEIAAGDALLSWELPFGVALQSIQPGNYVINKGVLEALSMRSLGFALPATPNFADQVPPFVLDEANFQSAPALPAYPETRTFLGYRRSQARGVGTRNTIVLLGTTSRTGSYVKQLAARLQDELKNYPQVDGIVPVAHTEGDTEQPNNLALLLRTLAGFIVNPNVGAVLIVDYGIESVTNQMVEAYLREHNYPLDEVLHRFLSIKGGFQDNLTIGEAIVQDWLPTVNAMERTAESISHLKIGLQCGGSDAFSGISANPLLGWIAQELIRYGGAANLAETDELIGAEPYVLQKVRDIETARKFLTLVEEFRARTAWHGANAEGNPSGGNKYRGLYNIYLKSIGAARKKDPATRLDYAIDYGSPMKESGFYFMDSPGNDLESVAGQVAAGCNLIFFTTGNGSITNFPFVPTVKVVTTTRRYQLLANDMDINAGQYQDGMSMDELGKHAFEHSIQIASGQRSVGEKAGHAQVQIWRNWRQTDAIQLDTLLNAPLPAGEPIAIRTDAAAATNPIRFTITRHQEHRASDHIGLILPTSLCAGQVANMIALRMNKQGLGQSEHLSRFVALAHTEGCGNSAGQPEQLYARTMIGYVTHPLVKHCLLLEHGCEKTHNDFMRHQMEEMGVDPSRLGFASIQLDGGIDKVTQKVEAWFVDQLSAAGPITKENVGLEALRIGILSDGSVADAAGEQLAMLTKMIVGAGGMVVVPENSDLFSTPAYSENVLTTSNVQPSLAYGEHARQTGFHIMETPTEHWVENVTGLAATGVELIIALVDRRPMQTHPFVPMLQVASEPTMQQYANDLDLLLTGNPAAWTNQILESCKQIIEHSYTPRLYQQGNVDFQLTRGLLGVSL